MRQKGQSASLAERLNNAMAQLHAQQIAFQTERGDFESQLEKLKEENDRLRTKNKELKRNNRENDFEGNRLSAENDGEGEQIAMKIQQYLARVQESSKQMAQIASECRIFDVEIEKASVQIEKNIVKSLGGLQKYVQELVRQWSHRETTRLENERLENENKYLFELTTKLQQNFKETDRILKHMQRGENRDEKYSQEIRGRMNKIEEENSERDTHARKEAITDLEGKITRLSEKVRSLEQENSTIKSIHQRTMKKLEKLEEKNRDRDEDEPIDGEGLQEERKRWLQKTEEMYGEVRRLNKELLIAEQSQKKVKDELAGCLEIYGQWEQERQDRKLEIDELKGGIETYLKKIEQLQVTISETKGEVEALCERLQISQGEKEKILSVYQLQVQELNDQLFKKHDTITELELIINKEHSKFEELKKIQAELSKTHQNLQEIHKKVLLETTELKSTLNQQESQNFKLKQEIKKTEADAKQMSEAYEQEKSKMMMALDREKHEKQELTEIMSQYKDEYYTARKELTKFQEEIESLESEQFSIKQELRSILEASDDTLDVWTLLGNVRRALQAFALQNKSLKDAQKTMIYQFQSKLAQATSQIDQLTHLYETIKETAEGQRKNEEISLKIYKMKLLQREICTESAFAKAKNIKQLLEIVIQSMRSDIKPSENLLNDEQIERLKEEVLALKEREVNLLENIRLEALKSSNLQEEIVNFKEFQEKANIIYKETLENLESALRQLDEEKSENNHLTQLLEKERENANQEMVALASELNKIQNQLEDFQDERGSVESKLDNARRVAAKNGELETIIEEMKSQFEQLTKEHAETQYRLTEELRTANAALESKQQQQPQHEQSQYTEKEQPAHYDSNSVTSSNKRTASASREILEDNAELQKEKADNQRYLFQIKELLQQNDELRLQIEAKSNRLNELQESIILLDENNRMLMVKIENLEETLQRKSEELLEYQAICTQIEAEKDYFAVLKEQLILKLKKEDQIPVCKDQNEDKLEYIDLTLELDAKMDKIDELEMQITTKDERIAQLLKELSELQSQILKLNQEKSLSHSRARESLHNAEIIAREEELGISLGKVHDKQQQLQREKGLFYAEKEKFKQTLENFRSSESALKVKIEELNEKQRQIQLQELSLFKKEQELRNLQKQLCQSEKSLLGIESMRQSKNLNHFPISNAEQSTVEQLKEQLDFAKKTIREKDNICHIKQSAIDQLILKQSESNQKLEEYEKELTELEEELNEYREHSQNLKSEVIDLKRENQFISNTSDQLKKDKEILQHQLDQLSLLLGESHHKSKVLAQEIEKRSIDQDVVDKLKGDLIDQKLQMLENESVLSQQRATIKQYTDSLEQKQAVIRSKVSELQAKDQKISEQESSSRAMIRQKEELIEKIHEMKKKYLQLEQEMAGTKSQNQQYAERLNEIEEIMQILKKEQEESQNLRIRLQEMQAEKQRLEASIDEMGKSYSVSASNFSIFEKRNKEMAEELTSHKQLLEISKQESEKHMKSIEKLKQQINASKQALAKYEKFGDFEELSQELEHHQSQRNTWQELKESHNHCEKAIFTCKSKIQQLQRTIAKKDQQISLKTSEFTKLQDEHRRAKENLRNSTVKCEQNEQLLKKIEKLKQYLQESKEQLMEREAKISELKDSISKIETKRELLEDEIKQKQRDYELLQKEIEHYKLEIKKISKEKAMAKSEAIKSRCSFEEQQSMFRMKESEIQDEFKKNYSEKEDMIKQLKQEINQLKESNSMLQEQSSIDITNRISRRSSQAFNKEGKSEAIFDMPLQLPPRNRQKSMQSTQKTQREEVSRHEYQIVERYRQILQEQNKHLKEELTKQDKAGLRLKQIEKSNLALSNEIQLLQRQLKGKAFNMENLQKQFKNKVEDYSKQQRIVQSLKDELNLERKRVKNFQDLYQSIQEKRIRVANISKTPNE